MTRVDEPRDLCSICGALTPCDEYDRAEDVKCTRCIQVCAYDADMDECMAMDSQNAIRVLRHERDTLCSAIRLINDARDESSRMRFIAAAIDIVENLKKDKTT